MTLRTLLMSAGTAAILAGGAVAQSTTTGTDGMATGDTTAGMAAPAPEFTSIDQMTVGDMLGMNAVDPEGSTIGDVDYVIQQPGGAAAVLGIGGFLGIGEYTVALPLEGFELNPEGTAFVLSTDKEALKAQQEFDESTAESLPEETPIASLLEADSDTDAATGAETGSATGTTDDGTAEVDTDDSMAGTAEGETDAGTDASGSDSDSSDMLETEQKEDTEG